MIRELDIPQRVKSLAPNEDQWLWIVMALILSGLVASVFARI
jgi:hypothetical protein